MGQGKYKCWMVLQRTLAAEWLLRVFDIRIGALVKSSKVLSRFRRVSVDAAATRFRQLIRKRDLRGCVALAPGHHSSFTYVSGRSHRTQIRRQHPNDSKDIYCRGPVLGFPGSTRGGGFSSKEYVCGSTIT